MLIFFLLQNLTTFKKRNNNKKKSHFLFVCANGKSQEIHLSIFFGYYFFCYLLGDNLMQFGKFFTMSCIVKAKKTPKKCIVFSFLSLPQSFLSHFKYEIKTTEFFATKKEWLRWVGKNRPTFTNCCNFNHTSNRKINTKRKYLKH